MIIKFNIIPVPKQSARFRLVNRPGGSFMSSYQPKTIKDFQKEVLRQAKLHIPEGFNLFSKALKAQVVYVFPPLKSITKRDLKFIEEGGRILKITKPDITDNLNKAFFDALEGTLFENDSRIAIFESTKYYGAEPAIILTLTEIPKEETYIKI